jgi:hypothetical protein
MLARTTGAPPEKRRKGSASGTICKTMGALVVSDVVHPLGVMWVISAAPLVLAHIKLAHAAVVSMSIVCALIRTLSSSSRSRSRRAGCCGCCASGAVCKTMGALVVSDVVHPLGVVWIVSAAPLVLADVPRTRGAIVPMSVVHTLIGTHGRCCTKVIGGTWRGDGSDCDASL